MKAVVDIVKKIISPEQNWSQFLMKIIGVGVVAGIGFAGFQVYTGSQEEEEGPGGPQGEGAAWQKGS